MPKQETKVIITTREQQQRYCMNASVIAVSKDGRGFEARANIISLLKSIRKDTEYLKVKFGEDVFDKLNEFNQAVAELIAYRSDIRKRVLNSEDVSSPRFLKYKEAVSKCMAYLFFVDEIMVTLVKGIDLEDFTIPSFYYAYATDKEIKMPPESEEFGGSYPVEPKGDKDLEEDIE